MPPVLNVYVYPRPANPVAPPPPLLGPINGEMIQNLFRLPAHGNVAGIQVNVVYDLTIGPMNANNPGSPGTCQRVAPPFFVFLT